MKIVQNMKTGNKFMYSKLLAAMPEMRVIETDDEVAAPVVEKKAEPVVEKKAKAASAKKEAVSKGD
jgi:hypothetical protein